MCTATLNDVDCDLASLSPLGTWTITIPVTVTATSEGTHNNTATVTSATADRMPANNSDTEPTTIDVLPDDQRHQDGQPDLGPRDGRSVHFTVSVTNNSTEAKTISSLSDSDYGDLNGEGRASPVARSPPARRTAARSPRP